MSRGRHVAPLHIRFWEKYIPEPNTGCWLWLGTYVPSGYGQIGDAGWKKPAHAVSWMLRNLGHVVNLPHRSVVMHKCDTPACVNPDHLALGDYDLNMIDASVKGRMDRGTDRWCAKLTPEAVRELRSSPESSRVAAARLGVSCSLVKQVRARKVWAWVS